MNKAAEDFFANLPSEKETEPEFKFMENKEAAPEKDKTPEAPAPKLEEHIEKDEQEPERKRPLRAERRLEEQRKFYEQKFAEEREARIRLEEQVKALADKKAEADPDIKRLLTEVKDPAEATAIFESLLSRAESRAEARALEKLQETMQAGDVEVNQMHSKIEDNIEAIEDRYGVDLTDDTDTRNAFLDFVEAIAPEDSDDLPNMNTAWKLFSQMQKAPPQQTQRKAAISTRSMTRPVQTRPEGKNLRPVSFDEINRGSWWERHISGK